MWPVRRPVPSAATDLAEAKARAIVLEWFARQRANSAAAVVRSVYKRYMEQREALEATGGLPWPIEDRVAYIAWNEKMVKERYDEELFFGRIMEGFVLDMRESHMRDFGTWKGWQHELRELVEAQRSIKGA